MYITSERSTRVNVDIEIFAWWECDNCGYQERAKEQICISNYGSGESELVWCLEGNKQRTKDCPKCQDSMIILKIDGSAFIDLTPFQAAIAKSKS